MTTEQMHTEGKKKGKFMKSALIVAIVIVLNMFFNYAISLAYKAPQYDNFVTQGQIMPTDSNDDVSQAVYQQQQNNFDSAQENYDRNVFIILVILGVAALIFGGVISNEILAPAFSWGGVFSLVIASGRYWSDANDLFKVIILALALILLIWFAIKKFGK